MSIINTNVPSLIAQRILRSNNNELGVSLERLSTGLRINRGADDPAGLIASEALRAESRRLDASILNAERAEQVINIAEGGLTEISAMLIELQELVTQSANDAGLSRAERDANQLQVDSILQTIDRIAGSTSFQGSRLLGGQFEYTLSNVSDLVPFVDVHSAKLGFKETMDVDVIVTQSARAGALFLDFGPSGAVDLGGDPSARFVVEIGGSLGAREFTFASGTTLAMIEDTINRFMDVTGVEAEGNGTTLFLGSVELGSREFVSVRVIDDGGAQGAGVLTANDDSFEQSGGPGSVATPFDEAKHGMRDFGQDVGAIVNGIVATGEGEVIEVSSDFLSFTAVLQPPLAFSIQSERLFTITGGGADFQISGNVEIAGKAAIGIRNVSTRSIGLTPLGPGASGLGALADVGSGRTFNLVDGNVTLAQYAVEGAIVEVSRLRGRLGAFNKNTLGSTIRSLGVTLENTVAAESVIRDTDFANETSRLTRSQILTSAATQTLALANTLPQNALSLLG